MMMLLYVGGDADFVQELEQHFPDYSVLVAGQKIGDFEATPSLSIIVVLDLALSVPALVQLESCAIKFCGAPLIVLAEESEATMTTIGLARLHGAEGFFVKPISDWNALSEAVRAAAVRLARWQELLQKVQP
jgi:hypothetical protein